LQVGRRKEKRTVGTGVAADGYDDKTGTGAGPGPGAEIETDCEYDDADADDDDQSDYQSDPS
jgi:hypothetical protein